MVNPQNTWAGTMTVADLKKIWSPEAQGKIMTWNQVRSEWPNQPIKLYGAGSDSGTFDYFTEAIVGKAKSSRGDYTASEDDNVLVQGIANDKSALGYFGFAYYIENKDKLKAVAIDNGKGGVLPSPQSVENGTYQPLARPIFIYINTKSLAKPEVKAFVEFYLANAQKLVGQVKYIPFSAATYASVLQRLESGKLGTAFAGTEAVGLKIDDILKREPKL
jgi:phosphate transport system substrate-binding protein